MRSPRQDFERAREIVLAYGWNTTCFQIVNPGIRYWFGKDGESVVGYVCANRVRVVAGAPVCSAENLERVSRAFEDEARAAGQSVCYFGAEGRLDRLYNADAGHSFVLLGAQPVWKPSEWPSVVASNSSLRAQLNRSRNKGVRISEWPVERARNSPELRECLESWLGIKGLPPLHFVIEPETLGRLEHRRVFVAERDSRVEAFLVLSPIPERSGWLTEQFPHRQGAPNGTVELMMDHAMRRVMDEGCEYLTLGLSPLSKRAKIKPFDNPLWLKFLLAWMRKHGQRFYNFEGLDRFKSKLQPKFWEPVFAISNESEFSGRTMWAIAMAFTENKPVRVLGRGILKAISAELGNFKSWAVPESH